jgi:MFS transporter, PAT family, beta-lactamase induction signal transducer AmpG
VDATLPVRGRAPTWIFGITAIPYGVCGGFISTLLPYFFREAGISVESIGWFATATMVPSFLNFLYAPVVDLGLRRRSWLILMSVLSALCLCAALMLELPRQANLFVVFTFAGQLLNGLVGSCNGGLMATTLDNHERGKAAGWLNAGNLGGGALGAGLILVLAQSLPKPIVATLLAATMILPALAALTIPELARPRTDAREHFRAMLQDVWTTAKSRPGWTGMLFCVSPVGTAALLNYFSGIAVDYRATPRMVALVNGALNGLITAVGSLGGGWLCDRMDRRVAYLVSGTLTAVVGIGMALGPLSPTTYAVGVCTYFLVSGFCYSAFSSVVLEAVGRAGASASAQYALFVAAGNLAITYVGWFDTRFHHQYGPRALLGVDAGLNLAGVLLLGMVIALLYRRPVDVVVVESR